MKYEHIVLLAASILGFTLPSALAQEPPSQPVALPTPVTRTATPSFPSKQPATDLKSFEFAGADLDTVMTMYCEWTGKIYLKNDNVNTSVSLKAEKLTVPECIDVVETILAMNNIAIVPYGEKFIKVIQANSADLTGEGLPLSLDEGTEYSGSDKLVSQIIPLKNVQIPEVQTAIQHLMHSFGKIQTLEASNSLLITDTESNILRIRDLVDFMDQASAKIEPRFYQISYAEARELAATLNEIITMAQSDASTGSTARRTIRSSSVIRARTATPAATRAAISSTEAGEQTIIQGNVKVMADERTNLILIFSQKENFDFFDKMIKTLDVAVEPAITFEVVNLEYADAEELSGTLNDLVGAAQGRTSSSSGSSSRSRTSSSSRSSSSRSSSRQPTPSVNAKASSGAPGMMVTPNATPTQAASIENLSQLSENTKILADARSNSILLMGRKSDIAAIKNVIANLDVMLEQVMIEAAIFEIGLTKGMDHGIQWLYQSQAGNKIGGWDAASTATNSLTSVAAGALKYYQNVSGINTELAIKLAASDNNARVLGTPVIMTTDNTEATLSIGEQRPVVTSTDQSLNSTQLRSSYEYKDIGIQLTVTPRINPQRFVVMEISQKADQLGEPVTIDNNEVPTILNREFEASVAVPDRGTIALGGLMSTEKTDSLSKIPILGDIPLLGRYLFSSVHKGEVQRELLVLMTPYVMTNHEELIKETERVYKKTSLTPEAWNWSESKLKQIPAERE